MNIESAGTQGTRVPPVPCLDGTEAEFQELRGLLRQSGFDQQNVCRRLGIPRLSVVDPEAMRSNDTGPLTSANDALIRLFLEGWPVSKADLDRCFTSRLRSLLERFQLIEDAGGGCYAATVTLYPIQELFVASDRYNNADGSPFKGWDDLVYPCLFATTDRLITGVPRTPCGTVLDLCAGTGIGGLLCAATAQRVLSVDLTARCVHFVRFNASLNGFAHIEARQGDLYEPVGSECFDRITVHPPYQPVLHHLQTFNSGGIDGEQIARGVIEGAPAHLNPGGRMYCLCQLTDREQPSEVRVRSWLTPEEQASVDIAFVCFSTRGFTEYCAVSALCENWGGKEWKEWMSRMRPLGIRDMAYGIYVIQRIREPRRVFTVRREGPHAAAAEIEALVDWETEAAGPGFADRVEKFHLRLRKSCDMMVRHQVERIEWKPGTMTLRNNTPFEAALQIDSLTAQLVARMDGKKPLGDHLRAISLKAPAEKVAALVRLLVSDGFVERVK